MPVEGGYNQSMFASLVNELRTPLVELALLAEQSGIKEMSLVSWHTLALYESYLLLQELSHNGSVDLLPGSLAAETTDTINLIQPLANMYGVSIDYKKYNSLRPVAINRRVYKRATACMLYSIITSMQNIQSSSMRISVRGGTRPKLHIFSPHLQILQEDISAVAQGGLQARPASMVDGVMSGMSIAQALYGLSGSKMRISSNQHGKSIVVELGNSEQLSLMG